MIIEQPWLCIVLHYARNVSRAGACTCTFPFLDSREEISLQKLREDDSLCLNLLRFQEFFQRPAAAARYPFPFFPAIAVPCHFSYNHSLPTR